MTAYQWPDLGQDEQGDDAPDRRGGFLARGPDVDVLAGLESARAAHARAVAASSSTLVPTGTAERWVPLGPSVVPSRPDVDDPRVTGRMRDIWVSPNGNRIYAAAAMGGVWYSNDAGLTWTTIGEFASSSQDQVRPAHRFSNGTVVAFPDPSDADNPAGDEVFVGTGEPGASSRSSPVRKLGGVGVLVATGPATSSAADPWTIEATNLAGKAIYRFARHPDTSMLVAATSEGLFQRPTDPTEREIWTRFDADPFDDLERQCTDVLWTAATADAPVRLWVWVRNGSKAGLWVRDGDDGDFGKVRTPGSRKHRAVLAAATPPTVVYAFHNRGEDRSPRLYRIESGADEVSAAERVRNVPDDMLGDQGNYNLAIAVDPSEPRRVAIGGKTHRAPRPEGGRFPRAGAIFADLVDTVAGRLVYGAGAEPQFVAVELHSDVHALRYADNGAQLWTGCDGGVFVSHHPTEAVGFVPRNNGISAAQTNFIACHPVCEGRIVSGLQDNGMLERLSSMVWDNVGDGDGGGVVFDPTNPTRYLRQFYEGDWTESEGTRFEDLLHRDAGRRRRGRTLWRKEKEASAFYSYPAAIARTDTDTNGDPVYVPQILIGTTRLWYTEDWGRNYVTLPTADDPIGGRTYNANQDDFGGPITACAWSTDSVAWALSDNRLQRYERIASPTPDHPVGQWERKPILRRIKDNGREVKNKLDDTKAEGPIRDARQWTEIEPDPSVPPSGADQILGGMYLGTVADVDNEEVDTLWWFDGKDRWHPTGLRTEEGIDAPVTALVCDREADPAAPVVYVGTTVGVWRGTRTAGLPDPTWTWETMLNGLPEAKTEDLCLYSYDGLRLLRAAVSARGVWEVRLDADHEDLTYVRVHDDDLRYRSTANMEPRDTEHHLDPSSPSAATPRSWHASPDVQIRPAPALVTAPANLPWSRSSLLTADLPLLQRFQAALRSKTGDERIVANGEWSTQFNEILRPFPGAEVGGSVEINVAVWNGVMDPADPHGTAEPWGSGSPTEADLVDLRLHRADDEAARSVSTFVPAGPIKVDVTVHHRGAQPVAGSDVRVTLLRWFRARTRRDGPHHHDSSTWFLDDIGWGDPVGAMMNASSASVPSNNLGDGWGYVGTSPSLRRKTLAPVQLDNMTTGVATFDFDVTPFFHDTVILLVAVIRAGSDISIPTLKLDELTMTSPNVAVRSFRVQNPTLRKRLR